jgi:uncharacterized membrane protein YtjA (UPF0391 family)
MSHAALPLLILALIAGFFGFSGLTGASTSMEPILFGLFLVWCSLGFAAERRGRA